jgi:hypothetical protein
MTERETSGSAMTGARTASLLERLRSWWRPQTRAERYLSEAIDGADLERRKRTLERESCGPPFETFNH